MPLSGTIVAFNEDLEDTPETVNEDAYGSGWMIKIKLSNAAEIENLLDAEAYTSLVTG
jgi:glycine cleavage system H protein